MTEPICPKCKSHSASRVKRLGFLQSSVLSHFGYYPWECGGCRAIFMFKKRGKLKRRRREEGEPHLPPIG